MELLDIERSRKNEENRTCFAKTSFLTSHYQSFKKKRKVKDLCWFSNILPGIDSFNAFVYEKKNAERSGLKKKGQET